MQYEICTEECDTSSIWKKSREKFEDKVEREGRRNEYGDVVACRFLVGKWIVLKILV